MVMSCAALLFAVWAQDGWCTMGGEYVPSTDIAPSWTFLSQAIAWLRQTDRPHSRVRFTAVAVSSRGLCCLACPLMHEIVGHSTDRPLAASRVQEKQHAAEARCCVDIQSAHNACANAVIHRQDDILVLP